MIADRSLSQDVITAAIREYRDATDNDVRADNRPLLAALTRYIAPSFVVPRDEIWLRRWDDAVASVRARWLEGTS